MRPRTPTTRRPQVDPPDARLNAGTMVKIGTPGYHKGDFYKAINLNKRRAKGKRTTTSSTTTGSSASTTRPTRSSWRRRSCASGRTPRSSRCPTASSGCSTGACSSPRTTSTTWPTSRCRWSRRGTALRASSASTRPGSRTPPSSRCAGWTGTTRSGRVPGAPHPQLAGDPQHGLGGAVLRDHGLPRPLRHRLIGVDAQGMGSAVADRMQRLMGSRCEVTPSPPTPRTSPSAGST